MHFRDWLPLCAILLLAACKPSISTSDAASCYPASARQWITVTNGSRDGHTATSGMVEVYLDGSGSMAGYFKGGTQQERPAQDILELLPVVTGTAKASMNYFRFGEHLAPLKADEIASMQRAEGYLRTPAHPQLDNQHSSIDLALAKVATAPKDSLSLVLTDLWLADKDSATTGSVALTRPLDAILKTGRSVAVYGIESPYSGRVSDWPGGRTDVTAERRYLFLLAIGPDRRLAALRTELGQIASKSIREGFSNQTVKYSLFTLDPVGAVVPNPKPFTVPAGASPAPKHFLVPHAGISLQQFALSRSAAVKAHDAGTKAPMPTWGGVTPSQIPVDAVWTGPVTGEATVWLQNSKDCSETNWTRAGKLDDGWRSGATTSYVLDPDVIGEQLTEGSYLIVGRAMRTGLDSPNRGTAWMREWSFSSSEARTAADRRVVPTLNLSDTAQMLEAALRRAATSKPVMIGGFAVALRVDS